MAVRANQTTTANSSVEARKIDLSTSFGERWQGLLDILGISRAIEKAPGTAIRITKTEVDLKGGNVPEGEEIPLSPVTYTEEVIDVLDLNKYGWSVSAEEIMKNGYNVAVGDADRAALSKIEGGILDKFYTALKTGTLTSIQPTFQMALAMARGYVVNEFQRMNKEATEIVGFVNTLDAYTYLGGAAINEQADFGVRYIQNFMGYRTIFLVDDTLISRGTVIACPSQNLVNYYINPENAEFDRAGLVYTTDGVSNLIGIAVDGNHSRAASDAWAVYGNALFAEYLNGISVVTFGSGSLKTATVTSAAGTETGDSKIKVVYTLGNGEKAFYKEGSAAETYTYGEEVDLTGYTEIATGADVEVSGLTASNVLSVVVVNGTGQAVASGRATIVVK